MTEQVDIHSFPPELPPQPDTDDVGGDELDQAMATHTAPLDGPAGEAGGEAVSAAAGTTHPACDYCGAPASLGVYYLADQAKEWVCYPCHAAMIAKALHDAADLEPTGAE